MKKFIGFIFYEKYENRTIAFPDIIYKEIENSIENYYSYLPTTSEVSYLSTSWIPAKEDNKNNISQETISTEMFGLQLIPKNFQREIREGKSDFIYVIFIHEKLISELDEKLKNQLFVNKVGNFLIGTKNEIENFANFLIKYNAPFHEM
jgi:hypothetical protein